MGELLEEALQRCPAQRQNQLQYILQQLSQDLPSQQGEEPEDSGDEGQDEEDDEEVRQVDTIGGVARTNLSVSLIERLQCPLSEGTVITEVEED